MSNDRYVRQTMFGGIGSAGQARLAAARVVIIGCGATGTVLANHLARAGVGYLRLVDRDFIELHNLQRQQLFDEDDLAANLPKAVAAARKLQAINSEIVVEGIVADANPETILDLTAEATLLLDGTDNFETRFLLNDVAVRWGIPWVYTGVVGGYGVSQTIVPGETACLRCLMPDLPPPGSAATCDTAGVVGPVVGAIGGISATEALKLIVGQGQRNPGLLHFDLWAWQLERIELGGPRPGCPTCDQRHFEFLDEDDGSLAASLCGRNAVQIRPRRTNAIDPAAVADALTAVAEISVRNDYLLRFEVESKFEITLFQDARAIIKGTDDENLARSLYARYIGN